MVVFGQVKLAGGNNLGMDFALYPGGYLISRFYGQHFLLVVMKEYGGHVLARPGTGTRAMALPENRYKLFIRDLGGIIVELDGLSMIAQIMISRIFFSTSRISHPGVHHPFEDPEPGVRTPESPESKRGGFGFGRCCRVYCGYPRFKNRCILHLCSILNPLRVLALSGREEGYGQEDCRQRKHRS